MKRLIADGSLASKSIKVGTRTRTVIDLEKSTLPIDADEHISVREAAKFLGLPVAVIKYLRVSGVYTKRPRLGHGSSWYEDDLQDFLTRGLSLVAKCQHAPDGVRLGQAMRLKFRDVGAKSAVVAAVLQGQIKLLGRVRDNLGGIILDKTELEVFVRSLRTETVRDTYLPNESPRSPVCVPPRSMVPSLSACCPPSAPADGDAFPQLRLSVSKPNSSPSARSRPLSVPFPDGCFRCVAMPASR